jgi:hypothetical protein
MEGRLAKLLATKPEALKLLLLFLQTQTFPAVSNVGGRKLRIFKIWDGVQVQEMRFEFFATPNTKDTVL